MVFYKIDVDEEVWQLLKQNAEPFEDTPNSVLKRLLLGRATESVKKLTNIRTVTEFPTFSPAVPAALAQILEVIYGVKKLGLSRKQATNLVAKKRGIATQTVIDKYCRQLDKRANDVDRLLDSKNPEELQSLLLDKFRSYKDVIRDFFRSLDVNV